MNNKNDIITPQFQIYNIYDKNNNINETIYEFERCYIKPEIDEIINSGIKNWQQANYKWLIGPEKIEITPDFIRFSMDGANKYTPILSWVAKNNTIENILNTAINITEKFALINNRNLLNRSIKTGNILISSKDNIKIKLFPINLFSDILYGKESIPDEESVLNDMIYLAPEYLYNESTSLKGVAEIYSLGVIFYELFTGITPFKSSEYEELMYSHLFREPVQMIDFNMDITPEISEVISKMLNKSPYDRYSTFNGLLYDLSLCKKYLSDYKKPKEFITGTRDILRTLRIPDKLYGREEHVATMIELFNESKNGSKNTLFISGPSGIGKTFLIKKAIKPLVTTSGIFITGKCKSISKNIPYEPLIEALNQLISPILIEQKEIKNIWKESILKAVGNNGRIITELIPAMEQIIGKQPPLPV
ncbi:MAG: AAA family ATPase, partial [Spirochaetota bacterium]